MARQAWSTAWVDDAIRPISQIRRIRPIVESAAEPGLSGFCWRSKQGAHRAIDGIRDGPQELALFDRYPPVGADGCRAREQNLFLERARRKVERLQGGVETYQVSHTVGRQREPGPWPVERVHSR